VFTATAAALPKRIWAFSVVWATGLGGLSLLTAAGCGGVAAQTRNAEGVRLFDQSRYQEAIGKFEQAINSDPDNADGYYNMAAVYHRLGTLTQDPSHSAQAEHYYRQCLDRDANHCRCYRGMAVLLVEQERSEEAFRLLEGWADRNPTSAEPKIELARLFEEFGDRQAAKEHLVGAIAADPQNARALAALGRLREQLGEHALALQDYQQSLWQDRFQPEVAARVAALQSVVSPVATATTGRLGTTQIVSRNTSPLR